MISANKDDIYKLAKMSGLELDEAEAVDLRREISRVLEYVNQLSELDVSSVQPTYQGAELRNVWREDEVKPSRDSQTLLHLAPESEANFIKVPRVL